MSGASAGGTAGHCDTVQPLPGWGGRGLCLLTQKAACDKALSREGHSIDPLTLEKTYAGKTSEQITQARLLLCGGLTSTALLPVLPESSLTGRYIIITGFGCFPAGKAFPNGGLSSQLWEQVISRRFKRGDRGQFLTVASRNCYVYQNLKFLQLFAMSF